MEAKLKNHKELFSNNLKIIKDDFINIKPQKHKLWFILFMEVLDNMPHDRVFFN